jgi:LysM repeat protein
MKRRFSITALLLVFITISAMLLMAWPVEVAASSHYPTGYWYAEYFDARWPTARPVYTSYDVHINFDWGTGSPNAAVPIDNFSARWTRTVDFKGGDYKFWAVHDDGILVWIDDQLVINQWYDQPAYMIYSPSVPNMHVEEVSLAPGPHRIKVEYYEHGKEAVAKFGWSVVQQTPSGVVPPPASTLQTDQIHTVRPGEWLYKIARTYNVSVHLIIEANGLLTLKVTPGQELVIPNGNATTGTNAAASASGECSETYVVQPGDNLFRISLKYDVSISAMAAKNGMGSSRTVHSGQVLCVP